MDIKPLRFISEPIQVQFNKEPVLEKKPGCPDYFIWRNKTYQVAAKISEWHDFGRRGKMAHNMRAEHIRAAKKRGSWGVGRYYFRVRTDSGRIFDIYYDRAPKKTINRKGNWTLLREMAEDIESDQSETAKDRNR